MIESYSQTKVMMAPSGELCLVLPVFANENGNFFGEQHFKELKQLKSNIGIYTQVGYIIFHDKQEVSIYLNSVKQFKDLGPL